MSDKWRVQLGLGLRIREQKQGFVNQGLGVELGSGLRKPGRKIGGLGLELGLELGLVRESVLIVSQSGVP